MKKLAICLALFTLALATALPAQSAEYISGRAGLYFPDESAFDTGYNFGIAYGFTFSQNPNVYAEFATGFYGTELKRNSSVDLTVIPFPASLILNHAITGTPFELYAGAGPGLYLAMLDSPLDDDTELELGVHLVGGGAFNIDSQFALFAELRGDLVTDDVGGAFLNFGLKYKF